MLERTKKFGPVSPFARLPGTRARGTGVRVSTRDNLGIASVLVKKNKEAALADRVQQRLNLSLPQALARTSAGGIAFAATGPQAWLATSEDDDYYFSTRLRRTLGDLVSISDQSDGLAVLRVAGPRVRETLAKLVPIDIHPSIFPVDMAVVTVAGTIGITMWRVGDQLDGTSAFELALYRSMAGSFWHALCESAAEFGLVDQREAGKAS